MLDGVLSLAEEYALAMIPVDVVVFDDVLVAPVVDLDAGARRFVAWTQVSARPVDSTVVVNLVSLDQVPGACTADRNAASVRHRDIVVEHLVVARAVTQHDSDFTTEDLQTIDDDPAAVGDVDSVDAVSVLGNAEHWNFREVILERDRDANGPASWRDEYRARGLI